MLLPSFLGFTASQILSQSQISELLDYYSVKFDGTNDYIDLGTSSIVNNRDDFSYVFWFKTDSTSVEAIASLWDSNTGHDWIIGVNFNTANKLRWSIYASATGWHYIESTTDVNDGKWHMGVCSYSTTSGMKLYVDGILEATDSSYGSLRSIATKVVIGKTSAWFWGGHIANFALYDTVLNDSNVLEIYNGSGAFDLRSNQGNYNTSGNLTGYWPLIAGTGTTVTDYSNNSNDGTLTNGPTWSYSIPGLLQDTSYALDFDGTDDYVDVDVNLNSLIGSGDLSISLWAKYDSFANSSSLFYIGNPSTNADYIYAQYHTDGVIKTGARKGTETTSFIEFAAPLLNTWYHIVITRSGTTGKLYINGVLEDSVSDSNWATPLDSQFLIGSFRAGIVPMSGVIDQFFVWNAELTIDQIQGLYHNSNKFHPLNNHKNYDKSGVLDLSLEFGEGSGTSALDKSDNKNNGTLTNGTTWTTDVAPITSTSWFDRNSLSFDGTNDYISISDDDSLSFGDGSTDSAFSISAWINADVTTNFRIAAKGSGTSNREWLFTLDTNSKFTLSLYDLDHNNMINGRYDTALSSGTWYHLLATYDGNKNISGLKLYINGISVQVTNNSVGSYGGMHETSGDLTIGAWDVSGYANGKINEVAMWNKELSSSEVLAIYNSGNPFDLNYNSGNYTSSDNLVGYWQFNENTGNTLYDYSGNGHNGTLTNGPTYSTDVP